MNPRLGIVCRSFRSDRGGQEKYMISLVERLIGGGFQLLLACEEAESWMHDRPGVEIRSFFPVKIEQGLRKWLFNRRARRFVNTVRDDLDLVITTGHVNFGDLYIANGGSHRSYLRQCGSWWSRLRPKNRIQIRFQETLFSAPNRTILAHSNMSKNDIVRDYEAAPENIRVIYHGVDTERFDGEALSDRREHVRRSLGYEPDDFVCLFTGGSWKRKGLDHTLKALSRVPDSSVKLAVVGRTKSRKARKLAGRLGVQDRVRLFGFTEAIEDFYVASDVLVFPSKYDSAGLVVLEALACGLPVITTKTTGMHEVIEPGINGFVVPRAEEETRIAENIQRLRKQDSLTSFREASYATGQQYSFEDHFQAFESLLRSQLTPALR